jgi:hypothetical protein
MKRYRAVLVIVFLLSVLPVRILSSRAQWVEGGLAVSGNWGGKPEIASDGAGGAIVTWYRNVSSYFGTIYAQHIGPGGELLWGQDGVIVYHSDDDGQTSPQIISDGAGGAIIAWENDENNNMIYAQRLDSDGYTMWEGSGVRICMTPSKDNHRPRLAPDGAGGAVICWFDGGRRSAHVQRLNAAGDTLWRGNGMPCSASENWAEYPEIISDGAGGAIVTWHEITPSGRDVYVQRVDAGGDAIWGSSGIAVCDLPGDQCYPRLVDDGAGGAFITWTDRRSPGHGLYAQRVDADGNPLWQEYGVVVSTAYSSKELPKIVTDGSGGAIIAWVDNRDGNKDLYTQRINASGDTLWPALGVAVCTEPSYQIEAEIIPDGAGGAIVTWEDIRSGNAAIYAQRVDAGGVVQWTTDGVLIGGSDTYGMFHPRFIPAGGGGAILTWRDGSFTSLFGTIFAQRIGADGEPVAAELKWFAASFSGSCVTIEWELAGIEDEARFAVMRGERESGRFEMMSADDIERDGHMFRFTDRDCMPGRTYRYRIIVLDESGSRLLFETEPVMVPAAPVILYQNYPNPFNPSTSISYYLPERCRVTLSVFSVDGAIKARLVDRLEDSGLHMVHWDGHDSHGNPLPSGLYVYHLTAGKTAASKKLMLLR